MGRLRSIASDSVEIISLLPLPACPQYWVQRCGRRWTLLFLCPQHRSAGMGQPEIWRSLGCSHRDGHIHGYVSVCLPAYLPTRLLVPTRSPQTLGRGVGPTVRNSIKGQAPVFWPEFRALGRVHSHAGSTHSWQELLLPPTPRHRGSSWCCPVPERTVSRTGLSRWTPGCQAISWAFGPALHPL